MYTLRRPLISTEHRHHGGPPPSKVLAKAPTKRVGALETLDPRDPNDNAFHLVSALFYILHVLYVRSLVLRDLTSRPSRDTILLRIATFPADRQLQYPS